MKTPRRVRLFKTSKKEIVDGEATFHCWNTDFEYEDGGPGNYPVAIIERDNGDVELVYAPCIRFIVPTCTLPKGED